jgi:hypothetical protein
MALYSTVAFETGEPTDVENGKILKRRRFNQPGDNIYLRDDHSLIVEMDVIKAVQRNFREKYYRPGGVGCQKVLAKYPPPPPPTPPKPSVNRQFLIDAMSKQVTKGRAAFKNDVRLAGQLLASVSELSETLHLVTNFEALLLSSNVDID